MKKSNRIQRTAMRARPKRADREKGKPENLPVQADELLVPEEVPLLEGPEESVSSPPERG